MSVVRTFAVKMVGDAQQLIKEFNKVDKSASGIFGKTGLGGKLSALVPSFKTISIAGTAAFGAITAAAGFAVKAAAEDAESQARLAQTLKATFGESQALVAETEKLISQFTKSAAVADDELRPAFGTLVRATGDFTQSQKLLQLALDISAGTGRDLESVTIALARASQGSTTALTRLGVPLDQNAVKAKDFDKIVSQLADTFEGQAEVKANSAAGRFKAFGIAVDELKEQFGTLLLPVVIDVIDFFTDRLIPAVQLAIDQFRSSGVRASLAYFVAAFGDAGKAVLEIIRNVALSVVSLGGHVQKAAAVIAAGAVPILGVRGAFDLYNKIVNASSDTTASINKQFDAFAGSVDYARKKLDIIAAGPMDYLERQLDRVTNTAKGTKTEIEDLGDETETGGKKVAKAGDEIRKFKDRLQDYTSAAKSAKSASDAFKRSQDRVAESGQSVADAEDALAAAQAQLAKAREGGTPEDRAKAERLVAAAQRGLARSQFNVEESVIAVRDAERRLAEVRGDSESTADDIRRAEIALSEAQFAVFDAQDSLVDETDQLAEARRQLRIATSGLRDGDEELVEFQTLVEDMQVRLADASKTHKEALEDETEALDDYRIALEKLGGYAALVPKYSAANPVGGLAPLPEVPAPSNPWAFGLDNIEMNVNIMVDSSIVNADQVAQVTAENLRRFTKLNGPLSNFMPV